MNKTNADIIVKKKKLDELMKHVTQIHYEIENLNNQKEKLSSFNVIDVMKYSDNYVENNMSDMKNNNMTDMKNNMMDMKSNNIDYDSIYNNIDFSKLIDINKNEDLDYAIQDIMYYNYENENKNKTLTIDMNKIVKMF